MDVKSIHTKTLLLFLTMESRGFSLGISTQPRDYNLFSATEVTIEEFKGRWTALKTLAPDRLNALRQVATIESIGSSTRIEGVKLSDQEIEHLLKGLDTHSFRSRDEEEVAGYAAALELIFESHSDIALSENHIKQLHSELLKYSSKDTRNRGEYRSFQTM